MHLSRILTCLITATIAAALPIAQTSTVPPGWKPLEARNAQTSTVPPGWKPLEARDVAEIVV
jgi:hypothetical protein